MRRSRSIQALASPCGIYSAPATVYAVPETMDRLTLAWFDSAMGGKMRVSFQPKGSRKRLSASEEVSALVSWDQPTGAQVLFAPNGCGYFKVGTLGRRECEICAYSPHEGGFIGESVFHRGGLIPEGAYVCRNHYVHAPRFDRRLVLTGVLIEELTSQQATK